MAIKAVPTKQLLKEYCNYSIMTSAAVLSGCVAYSFGWDKSLNPAGVFALTGAAWSIPAVVFSLRSFGRLLDMTAPPRQMIPITIGAVTAGVDGPGAVAREFTVNDQKTFLNSIPFLSRRNLDPAFDPTVRGSDDITTRKIKYKPERGRLLYWDQDVIMRNDRVPIRVRLYEDLVIEIIGKGWRAQRGGRPHPLGAEYLCSLHYSSRGNRRLRIEEHRAFVQLGNQYGIVEGNRQGHSGWLAGDWAWCFAQLGLPQKTS